MQFRYTFNMRHLFNRILYNFNKHLHCLFDWMHSMFSHSLFYLLTSRILFEFL